MRKESCIGFSVTPVTAVGEDEIEANVKSNLNLIKNWIDGPYRINNGTAYVISGGPSFKDQIEEVKKNYVEGVDVLMCVKHSLNTLVDAGLEPDYCVALDPRPITGVSTHGILREELFTTKEPLKKTIFLLGSMIHPSVVEYLLKTNQKVIGFHALVSGIERVLDPQKELMISGGTSSGLRAISIAHLMGYRKFKLFGFDSSFQNLSDGEKAQTDSRGRNKYFTIPVRVKSIDITKGDMEEKQAVGQHLVRNMAEQIAILAANGYTQESRYYKSFTVSGELVAQLQDIENWVKTTYYDLDIWMAPSGTAGSVVFDTTVKDLKPYKEGNALSSWVC